MKVKTAERKCNILMESILNDWNADETFESKKVHDKQDIIKRLIVNYNLKTRDYKKVLLSWDIMWISKMKAFRGVY